MEILASVYLVELRGTDTFFAMKVMDKESLISRNKLIWAETEREILSLLDHPFLIRAETERENVLVRDGGTSCYLTSTCHCGLLSARS